jgi:hypothetical protein
MFKTGKKKFSMVILFLTNSETAGVKTKSYYFEHALRVANANKRQSVMIGDSRCGCRRCFTNRFRCYFFNESKLQVEDHIKQVSHLLELKNIYNMKKQLLFIALFISGLGIAQSVNDYKAVIIPLKFEFMKSDNQYRLATLSKLKFE